MSPHDLDASGTSGPHVADERCLDLVHGLLPGDELERVLQHVRGCASCESRVRRITADREALRARFGRGGAAVRGVERASRWRLVRRWLPIAAAATLVIAFAVRTNLPARAPVAGRWIPVEQGEILRRGAGAGMDPLLRQGLLAYARRDAVGAVRSLRASRVQGSEAQLRSLYLASALVWSSRPVEALGVLDSLTAAGLPEPWRSEALWVRYLALDRAGRRAAADAQLRALQAAPGDVGRLARERAR